MSSILKSELPQSASNSPDPIKEHCLNFLVRDNECDQLQGVNNSHYMCYFEHARFQYFREHLGVDVAKLTRDHNLAMVVKSCSIEFHRSLVANDRFYVKTRLERIGRRKFQFSQNIYHCESDSPKPLATAVFLLVTIEVTTGRAKEFEVMDEILSAWGLEGSDGVATSFE